MTGEVRFGYEVAIRIEPCPSSPPRGLSAGSVTRLNRSPRTPANAVVPGQALVQERVVGVEQIDDAAILAHDALEEQLRLLLERLAQVVVEVEQRFRDSAGASATLRMCSH